MHGGTVARKSGLRVKSGKLRNLDGKVRETLIKVSDGSIITRFSKTPFPRKDTDVVCPHFLQLKWAAGCRFDCAWCYLRGTLRFFPEWLGNPHIKDFAKLEKHLVALATKYQGSTLLSSGELSDSFVAEHLDPPFTKFVYDILEEHDPQLHHKILLLTKSNNVKNLLTLDNTQRFIVSFSVNAHDVAKRWEKKAPSPKSRIAAAKRVHEKGYVTRLRIDPMVSVENWNEKYLSLIDDIFSKFVPDSITLGSLRGLQSTINAATDKSWVKYLSESSNWGKKIPFDIRFTMYLTLIQYLKDNYNYRKVGLCKETLGIWKALSMNFRRIRCNCVMA